MKFRKKSGIIRKIWKCLPDSKNVPVLKLFKVVGSGPYHCRSSICGLQTVTLLNAPAVTILPVFHPQRPRQFMKKECFFLSNNFIVKYNYS